MYVHMYVGTDKCRCFICVMHASGTVHNMLGCIFVGIFGCSGVLCRNWYSKGKQINKRQKLLFMPIMIKCVSLASKGRH